MAPSPYVIEGSPLFEEYLGLIGDMPPASDLGPITKDDVLLVIDMQADFVPKNRVTNPHGGRFGVAEAELIVNPICAMMERFANHGATVVACRDYHPSDHVCFFSQGGHLPPHCVEGSRGSYLLAPIATTMSSLLRRFGPEKAFVVFKGFHEDVDSFGAFPYDAEYGSTRLLQREPGNALTCSPCAPEEPEAFGFVAKAGKKCSLTAWTGCLKLKQSAILHAYDSGEDADMNAPPDILAADGGGADGDDSGSGASRRGRTNLPEALAGKKRLFVCGLAFDFCVLDTCINARLAGFDVWMIVDGARPAHIPGVGVFGTGFLSDPADVKAKLATAGVAYTSFQHLLSPGDMAALHSTYDGKGFPEELGPLGIANTGLYSGTTYDPAAATYTVDLHQSSNLSALMGIGFDNHGKCSPPAVLPSTWTDTPPGAVSFCWAYPMVGVGPEPSSETTQAMGMICLEVSHAPDTRFALYGGYILLDAGGAVVAVQAITLDPAHGEDLCFEPPRSFRQEYVQPLVDASRFGPVTLPELRRHGALEFCWLMPGETLKDESGTQTWVPSGTGGFVYIMSRDGDNETLFFNRKPPKLPEGTKADDASAYMTARAESVEDALTQAVQALIEAEAADPIDFLGKYLLASKAKGNK